MEFDLQTSQFMLEKDNDNAFIDWLFATDSPSDIAEIVSAESVLAPFPDSMAEQVDFEVPDLRPFAMLPVDNFSVPNYQVPWYHLKEEINQNYVPLPSDVYSLDPYIQILEALSLINPVPITSEIMDTGKSCSNEEVFTQGTYFNTNGTSILAPSNIFSVADPNTLPFDSFPLNPVPIVSGSMDTGKSAMNEDVFTQDLYVDAKNSTSVVHDDGVQILEVLPLNTALITPEDEDNGKSTKNEAAFTQDVCVDETVVDLVEEKVTSTMERRERSRLAHLGYNEIKRYFYMPITQAAKEMKVGLTILKKRCRELGIPRWPHRKMKSLRSLIHNVQELEKSPTVRNMTNELEELGRLMEENPEMQLTEKTKKLRQACFKASYKKRRGQLTTYYQLRF